jgi:hypothetical protein
MASLRELQRSFAAALRDPAVACAVLPQANLSIYRNNSNITHRMALEGTFPVIRKRVGDEYFRQLAHHFRLRFPSRSGDLHWAGRDFAAFLDDHLRGSDYAWLADLARLEWYCSEASVAIELPAAGAETLGRFAPEQLENVVFGLQPSLRLHSSSYPVFSVWQANQTENAPPVDQSSGPEQGLVRIHHESLEIRALAPDLFSYICATARGATLGEAMTAANVDGPRLGEILGFLFSAEVVSSVSINGQGVGTSS